MQASTINTGKKAGRPPVNATTVELRLRPEELAALDAARGDESRPLAARRILREKLLP